MLMMSIRVVPPKRLEYRLNSSTTFDPTMDRTQIFRVVSVGSFPWSSMESLLHVVDVRLGRTTDHWIPLKFLEFQYAIFLEVAWNRYSIPKMSV